MAAQTLSALTVWKSSSIRSNSGRNGSSSSLVTPCNSRTGLGSSLFGNGRIAVRIRDSVPVIRKRRCSTVMTVSFSLPTAWSARSIKSFAMGELEARKLKYPKTGTEALLMGILVEGTSNAAKFLRANGVTLFKVRDETIKLLGKSDMYFFSPEHPPLTEPAQRALDWAVDEKLKSGDSGEITTTHLLLGIWSEKESAGHKILAALGFDDTKAAELAKSGKENEYGRWRWWMITAVPMVGGQSGIDGGDGHGSGGKWWMHVRSGLALYDVQLLSNRRKCVVGCIFAPYFDSEQGAVHFAAVHKVFGASNVSKLLLHIPVHKRPDAVLTICYEAQSRLRDPVYGCVAHIFALQQQVVNLQAELSYMQAHLATLQLPSPPPLPPPPPQVLPASSNAPFLIPDLASSSSANTSASAMPSSMNFELSSLFDPLSTTQHTWQSWPHHQQNNQQQRHLVNNDPRQYASSSSTSTSAPTASTSTTSELSNNTVQCSIGGDLQALARELLQRHNSASSVEPNIITSVAPPR
ncbi:hypothetical protein Scep_006336 [Stephania cephalantha]|uniref:Clp R domain-containing protein n=1 Tax=Stephania cephalantha TaxID=152367 RepID=A0AAP0PM45_9MAGN